MIPAFISAYTGKNADEIDLIGIPVLGKTYSKLESYIRRTVEIEKDAEAFQEFHHLTRL